MGLDNLPRHTSHPNIVKSELRDGECYLAIGLLIDLSYRIVIYCVLVILVCVYLCLYMFIYIYMFTIVYCLYVYTVYVFIADCTQLQFLCPNLSVRGAQAME